MHKNKLPERDESSSEESTRQLSLHVLSTANKGLEQLAESSLTMGSGKLARYIIKTAFGTHEALLNFGKQINPGKPLKQVLYKTFQETVIEVGLMSMGHRALGSLCLPMAAGITLSHLTNPSEATLEKLHFNLEKTIQKNAAAFETEDFAAIYRNHEMLEAQGLAQAIAHGNRLLNQIMQNTHHALEHCVDFLMDCILPSSSEESGYGVMPVNIVVNGFSSLSQDVSSDAMGWLKEKSVEFLKALELEHRCSEETASASSSVTDIEDNPERLLFIEEQNHSWMVCQIENFAKDLRLNQESAQISFETFQDVLNLSAGVGSLILPPGQTKQFHAALNILHQSNTLAQTAQLGVNPLKFAISLVNVCSAISLAIDLFGNQQQTETAAIMSAIQGLADMLGSMWQQMNQRFDAIEKHLLQQDQQLFRILLRLGQQNKKLDSLLELTVELNHAVKNEIKPVLALLSLQLSEMPEQLFTGMTAIAMERKKEKVMTLLRRDISRDTQDISDGLFAELTNIAISPLNLNQMMIDPEWLLQYSDVRLPKMHHWLWWVQTAQAVIAKYYEMYGLADDVSGVEMISENHVRLFGDVVNVGENLLKSAHALQAFDLKLALHDYQTILQIVRSEVITRLDKAFTTEIFQALKQVQPDFQLRLFEQFRATQLEPKQIKCDYPGWFGGFYYHYSKGGDRLDASGHRQCFSSPGGNHYFEQDYQTQESSRINAKLEEISCLLSTQLLGGMSGPSPFEHEVAPTSFSESPTLTSNARVQFALPHVQGYPILPLPQALLEHCVVHLPILKEWLITERLGLAQLIYRYQLQADILVLKIEGHEAHESKVLGEIAYPFAEHCTQYEGIEKVYAFWFGAPEFKLQAVSRRHEYNSGRCWNTHTRINMPYKTETFYPGVWENPEIAYGQSQWLYCDEMAYSKLDDFLYQCRMRAIKQVIGQIQEESLEQDSEFFETLNTLRSQVHYLKWWFEYTLPDLLEDEYITDFLHRLYFKAHLFQEIECCASRPGEVYSIGELKEASFIVAYTNALMASLKRQKISANYNLVSTLNNMRILLAQYRAKQADETLTTADKTSLDLIQGVIDVLTNPSIPPQYKTLMANSLFEPVRQRSTSEQQRISMYVNQLSTKHQLAITSIVENGRLTLHSAQCSERKTDATHEEENIAYLFEHDIHCLSSKNFVAEIRPFELSHYLVLQLQQQFPEIPNHLLNLNSQDSIAMHFNFFLENPAYHAILFESIDGVGILYIRASGEQWSIMMDFYMDASSQTPQPKIRESVGANLRTQAILPVSEVGHGRTIAVHGFPLLYALDNVMLIFPHEAERESMISSSNAYTGLVQNGLFKKASENKGRQFEARINLPGPT